MTFSPYSMNRAAGWAGDLTVSGGESTDNDQVNAADPLFFSMASHWDAIRAVTEGTDYLRQNCDRFLPQQPMELADSWQGRVNRSTFSNYFGKVLRTAVGLILRKQVRLECENDADQEWWDDWAEDPCRDGSTDLDQFCTNLLESALSFGHSAVMVDYATGEGIRTLADEQEAELKPYLVEVKAPQIIGWRHSPTENRGRLQQVRIRESARVPVGKFGIEYRNRVRVLEPGNYSLYESTDERGDAGWQLIESGKVSVKEVPLCVVYGDKRQVLYSKPPLLSLAHQNLHHFRVASDLTQSLHIAAQPLLIGKGLDDLQNDNTSQGAVGLSVNNMLLIAPEASVEYVVPQVGAFDSHQVELERIVSEMKSLSIALLSSEKNGVEAAKAKALDRIDSNSVLSVVSKSLQACIQDAVNLAAEYAGREAPEVVIIRDFSLERLEGQDITAINSLFTSGLIPQEVALTLLQEGEVLDDQMDVDEIMSQSENEELASMEQELDKTDQMMTISDNHQNAGSDQEENK